MSEESKPSDVFHPVYRELSEEEKDLMAKAKLEEAVMWAVKGINK